MSSSPITEVKARIERLRARGGRQESVPPPLPTSRPRHEWKYLKPEELGRLRNLLFAAKTIVEGYYAGRHKSPFKGSAPEFSDHREYTPGDEIRTVDWRVFARTERFFVKRFEQETDMACSILLDSSASMAYRGVSGERSDGKQALSKFEYGAYLTAALAFLMIRQGDKAGLTLFDTEVRAHLPPAGTVPHLYKLLRALEGVAPRKQTSLAEVLRKSHPLIKRRGLLIIVSDFLDDPDAVFKALSRFMHRRFEILLFHVFHEDELHLPELASAEFIDAEQQTRLTCLPDDLRTGYNAEIRGFLDTWSNAAKSRGIDYRFITTATPYAAALEHYMVRRGKA